MRRSQYVGAFLGLPKENSEGLVTGNNGSRAASKRWGKEDGRDADLLTQHTEGILSLHPGGGEDRWGGLLLTVTAAVQSTYDEAGVFKGKGEKGGVIGKKGLLIY